MNITLVALLFSPALTEEALEEAPKMEPFEEDTYYDDDIGAATRAENARFNFGYSIQVSIYF